MRKILIFFTVSLLAHIFLFMLLIVLEILGFNALNSFHNRWATKKPPKNKITITRVEKKDLEQVKFKNLGKENAVKNIFNAPINKKLSDRESDSLRKPTQVSSTQSKQTENKSENKSENKRELSLSSLRIIKESNGKYLFDDKRKKRDQIVIKKAIDKEKTEKILEEMQREESNHKNFNSKTLSFETKTGQLLLPNSLTSLHPSREDLSALPSLMEDLNLSLRFEVPQGVSYDKLNEQDLKFYSFNMRVFRSYINAIFRAYESFKRENPHIDLNFVEKQVLVATVLYSVSGKIEQISFIQSSNNDKVQGIFQRALEQNNVFNPPREIVKDGHFYLNYQLIINP
ncbi:MAG: hypothetical protein HQK49_07070 [Oligoflexia bacterium]|nr:hypothetical protein [Oligoflexia bacterium]